MKKELKGTEMQKFFVEFWEFIKEHFEPEDNDEYWEDLISGLDELSKKHGADVTMRLLVCAFADSCDERYHNNIREHKVLNVNKFISNVEYNNNYITLNGIKYVSLNDIKNGE